MIYYILFYLIDIDKIKKENIKDAIDFYNNNIIISFNKNLKYKIDNNYFSYFSTENILQKRKYNLGKIISEGKIEKFMKDY